MSLKDYYQILGISRNAGAEDIRKASIALIPIVPPVSHRLAQKPQLNIETLLKLLKECSSSCSGFHLVLIISKPLCSLGFAGFCI